MPNNVVTELVIRGVGPEKQAAILSKVINPKGRIDFGLLLPIPLNIWMGDVGERHEKRFPGNALNWCRENWGTKWNAYGLDDDEAYRPVVQTDDTLTLIFQTAWAPPMGWIVALFNFFELSFDHNWLDEGEARGHHDTFCHAKMDYITGDPWTESAADDEMQKHLHVLLWGCESFDDEGDEA